MLRKMIRRGFERKSAEDSDEENFSYLLSNSDVLQICKTEDIMSHVANQQFKYLAHISRRSNNNVAKRLLFNDDKTRKRGRPVKTMEQHVLQTHNISADEFYRRA